MSLHYWCGTQKAAQTIYFKQKYFKFRTYLKLQTLNRAASLIPQVWFLLCRFNRIISSVVFIRQVKMSLYIYYFFYSSKNKMKYNVKPDLTLTCQNWPGKKKYLKCNLRNILSGWHHSPMCPCLNFKSQLLGEGRRYWSRVFKIKALVHISAVNCSFQPGD